MSILFCFRSYTNTTIATEDILDQQGVIDECEENAGAGGDAPAKESAVKVGKFRKMTSLDRKTRTRIGLMMPEFVKFHGGSFRFIHRKIWFCFCTH